MFSNTSFIHIHEFFQRNRFAPSSKLGYWMVYEYQRFYASFQAKLSLTQELSIRDLLLNKFSLQAGHMPF
jgi:hypothetical protein